MDEPHRSPSMFDIPDVHNQFREYTPADLARLQRNQRARAFME